MVNTLAHDKPVFVDLQSILYNRSDVYGPLKALPTLILASKEIKEMMK